MNETKTNIKYEEFNIEGKTKLEQIKEYQLFFKNRENSVVVDLFYVEIINIFKSKCNCGARKRFKFKCIL